MITFHPRNLSTSRSRVMGETEKNEETKKEKNLQIKN